MFVVILLVRRHIWLLPADEDWKGDKIGVLRGGLWESRIGVVNVKLKYVR